MPTLQDWIIYLLEIPNSCTDAINRVSLTPVQTRLIASLLTPKHG
ncbi:hypothetical protein [Nostoc mirabile]|nr:hypothetical protein [Nostoc mirabile]